MRGHSWPRALRHLPSRLELNRKSETKHRTSSVRKSLCEFVTEDKNFHLGVCWDNKMSRAGHALRQISKLAASGRLEVVQGDKISMIGALGAVHQSRSALGFFALLHFWLNYRSKITIKFPYCHRDAFLKRWLGMTWHALLRSDALKAVCPVELCSIFKQGLMAIRSWIS